MKDTCGASHFVLCREVVLCRDVSFVLCREVVLSLVSHGKVYFWCIPLQRPALSLSL